ncbi:cytidyltransferase [Thermoplasmatales archaeon SG8-52-4]|nr:MAG: cytidyltransferase [Thermoplasmatales archaeon SG8-52-4]
MKVCFGGTFNILHKGHKNLINKAFKVAGPNGSVFIGLSTDNFVKNKVDIKPYSERRIAIENYLKEKGYFELANIKPISDRFGPTLEEDFDIIIVSQETTKNADEINLIRKKNGKKPLKIIKIPLVLAKDGLPISSTRIHKKDIDIDGNSLKKD